MSAHPVFETIFTAIFGTPERPTPPAANTFPDSLPAISRPDNLDVIDMNNESINEIRDSCEAEENAGRTPRMDYGRLSAEQIEEGHQTEIRR
ncbi:hypothetical protein [Pseudoxanthomonas sacheonensis]|uniref:hypothetical protein n=1 Tax=Pseudoxanthomonas sacheonensis TaxID=443615 RepID=UPI0013D666B9|nr:hypothetical protein [Pseudoxanthomonas sacheonensis]KAF1706257.1 hypothetical protein CSC73_16250 [Pseudoxanthomonas sacheonensis]